MIFPRWLLLPLFIAALGETCAAAEPQPQVRVTIAQQREVWVGQRVTLVVELLTPGTFASAPSFDLPRLSGVVLIPPSDSPTVGSETIDDTTYTTQRHELGIFAQRAGNLEIPSFAVRFASAPAFGQPAQDHTVLTKAVKFEAQMPPGAAGLAMVITTSDLKVSQAWDPQPTSEPIKLGAAFTRTITIEASDIPAMVLPSFPHEAPPGLGVYPRAPTVEDKSNRGVTTGRRIDAVTFVCESPGTFDLPALAIAWWDPKEHQLKRIELAGQRFEVATAPQSTKADSPASAVTRNHWIVLLTIAVAGVVLVCLVLVARSQMAKSTDSEAIRFAELERACDGGDPHKALAALYAWIDQIAVPGAMPNVAAIAACGNDPLFAVEVDALEAVCYGRSPSASAWSPKRLLSDVKSVRRRLKHNATPGHEIGDLSPLNP